MGEHGGDHLRLVAEPFREQRPDRSVDKAGGKRFLFGRPSLALEISAGDLTRGESLLLVIHGKREKVDARSGFLCGNDGGEHRCAAILSENGGVRLAGDASGLEPERSARPFDFYGVLMQHDVVSTHREW